MEELLVSYNDKPFVSESYRNALDGVGGRAERMAIADLPLELPEWMETLGQQNVRTLSVRLLIDLLTIEQDPVHAGLIAEDMEALAEDLLLSGAYDDALAVTRAIAERAQTAGGIGRDACRQALDRLGESLAMRETVALIGDVDEAGWQAIKTVIGTIGVATVESLKPALISEEDTVVTTRVEEIIVGFRAKAVGRLASIVSDSRWFVQKRAARLMGRIASADAVPLLQPLLRGSDPRVVRQAVSALGAIQDPAAARAIHTVLRAATGSLRTAVIDALVADRDPRVVPMLVQIIQESEPLGKDHDVVLDTVTALGKVGTDGAVPALVTLARRKAFFGRRKLRALKEHSVDALTQLRSNAAGAALREAGQTGDRMLKKIVASRTK
jgi:hypothetical protein